LFAVKRVSLKKTCENVKYKQLLVAYCYRIVVFGCVSAALFYLSSIFFVGCGLFGILAFMWAMLLLFETDYRTMLLPDIITIPLLIGGFGFSVFCGVWVLSAESVIGAVVGYLLPIVAGLLLVRKHPDAIGGGDIKLLAAIGAWVGVLNVIYVILLSCLIFAVFALLSRKKVGAFGPAITMAAIIVAFYFF